MRLGLTTVIDGDKHESDREEGDNDDSDDEDDDECDDGEGEDSEGTAGHDNTHDTDDAQIKTDTGGGRHPKA